MAAMIQQRRDTVVAAYLLAGWLAGWVSEWLADWLVVTHVTLLLLPTILDFKLMSVTLQYPDEFINFAPVDTRHGEKLHIKWLKRVHGQCGVTNREIFKIKYFHLPTSYAKKIVESSKNIIVIIIIITKQWTQLE